MDSTIGANPGVLAIHGSDPTHHHHHDRHGLEGKDAVMIEGFHTTGHHLGLNESISRNSKENVIHMMESKFALASAIKDTDIRAERLMRETLENMNSMRLDLQKDVHSEGEKTRELLMEMERKRVDAALAKTETELMLIKAKLACCEQAGPGIR